MFLKERREWVYDSIIVNTHTRIVNVMRGLRILEKLNIFVTKLTQKDISVKNPSHFNLSDSENIRLATKSLRFFEMDTESYGKFSKLPYFRHI